LCPANWRPLKDLPARSTVSFRETYGWAPVDRHPKKFLRIRNSLHPKFVVLLIDGVQSKDFKPSTECILSSALRFDFFGLPIRFVARGDGLKVASDLDYDRAEKLD
jgi:hypothetical protein